MGPKKAPSSGKDDDGLKSRAGSKKSQGSVRSLEMQETPSPRGKSKPPKQLTAKQKEKLVAEEKARKMKLEELIREAEAKKQEFVKMQSEAKAKDAKERVEQRRRERTFVGVVEIYKMMYARLLYERVKRREEEAWERYRNTENQAPFPEDPANMSVHLYHWRRQLDIDKSIDKALSKCQDYMGTLDILDNLLQDPVHVLPETVDLWAETRNEWRNEMLSKLDKAIFHVIRNVDKHFRQLNFYEAYFAHTVDRIKLAMWAWLDLPITDAHVREMPEIAFKELNGVKVLLPPQYAQINVIIRVLYLDSDFHSDTCPSYYLPEETTVKMEENILEDIKRCNALKQEIREELAEYEKEKLKQAKMKIMEARNAVLKAEQSLHSYRSVIQDKLLPNPSSGPAPPPTPPHEDQPIVFSDIDIQKPKKKRKVGLFLQGDVIPGSKPNAPTRDDRKIIIRSSQTGILGSSSDANLTSSSSSALVAVTTLKEHYRTKVELFYSNSMTTLDPPQRPIVVIVREKSKDLGISRLEDLISLSSESMDSEEEGRAKAEEEKRKQEQEKKAQEERKKEEMKKKAAKGTLAKKLKTGAKRRTTSTAVEPVQQTPSVILQNREEIRQWEYIASLETRTPSREYLNLREYRIVGGIYYIDILEHLPQPLRQHDRSVVQYLVGEAATKIIDFRCDYVPPPPIVVEEGMPQPPPDQNLKKLIKLQLPLPMGVAFFARIPQLVMWDAEASYWSTKWIYRSEISPAGDKLTCLLGKTGPLAFALHRFESFLPFNSWNLRPLITDKEETRPVELTLKTKSGNFSFIVRGSKVKLDSAEIDDKMKATVEPILKKELHVIALIKAMRSIGLDVFPEEDSFHYVPENTSKDKLLEEHNYMVMAIFCSAIDFSSSKWNYAGGRRNIKYQARGATSEGPEIRYTTVNSTMWRADMFKVNDESDEFVETKLNENYGFCADSFTLLEKVFPRFDPWSCTKVQQIMTIFHLLLSTRVLSYSGVTPTEAFSQADKTSENSTTSENKRKRKRKSSKPKLPVSKITSIENASSRETVSSKSVVSQKSLTL